MDRNTSTLVTLILLIVATGLYLLDSFGLGRRPTAFCAIAAAMVTFFWFISGARRDSAGDFASAMRTGIAASLTVLYIILVGIFAFWQPYLDQENKPIPTPDITILLLNNFTYVIGVVIAFYFGSSVLVEARSRAAAGPDGTTKSSPAQPTG
jgi:hypothetical protein